MIKVIICLKNYTKQNNINTILFKITYFIVTNFKVVNLMDVKMGKNLYILLVLGVPHGSVLGHF